ncbi:hypothetical protein RF55_18734 [Lasius niger]|uniref:Uncharacterized protein n=1 Tax=Lasius niger TaxID=67767 RepID=A0A0J7K0W8_LASNI|nr:hypothetical protein RF55_18734 [Lasius niger]
MQLDASDPAGNEASEKENCKKNPKIAVSLALSNGQTITGGNGGSVLRTEGGELAVASGGNSGSMAVTARFDARRLKKLTVGKPNEWTTLLGTNNEVLLKVAPGKSGKTAILKAGTMGFSGINPPNLPSEGDVLSFEIPGALGERGIIFNGDPAAPLILGGKGGSTAYGHGGLGGVLVQNSAQHATGYGSGGGGAATGENSPRNPGGLCGLALLSACDQLTIVDKINDPECKWDHFLRSSKNVKAINQTVGKPDGISRPISGLSSRLGRVDTERLAIIRIKVSGAPNVIRRYAKLYYVGGGSEEGVLVETSQGQYAPYQIRWIPNQTLVAALKKHDEIQPNARVCMGWVHPQLDNPKINICVGRVTAEGMPEEFPYQTWAYCADPKSKKDLTPRYMPIFRETSWGT